MAPADIGLGRVHRVGRRLALLQLDLVEPRLQHRHRLGAVLVLRALALAGDDDRSSPGGVIGDAHRAVGLVDVLAAGARGAVGVDAQILVLDLDLDLVVDHRIDPDRGEAGVAARVGVERRDAHQAMHAAFGLEPAIGIGAVDPDRRRFDAGALAGALLEPFDLVAVLPRPSAYTCAAASRPSPAPRCRRRRHGLRDSSRWRRPRPTAGFRARAAAPRRAASRASPRPRRAIA